MTIELEQKQKRLTSGKKGCYDKVGNREQVTENAITTTYKPNTLNQYETINGAWLKYDNNGNLAKYQGIEYTYDAQNRLLSVNSNNNPIATFTYDARNRCIKRVINGTTNYLYYDNWNLIEEYDASNNLLASYFHGNRMDEILTRITPITQIYYHHDSLGNVTHLSDLNGHIVEKYVYDPFGKPTILNAVNTIIPNSAYENRFLFTGREYLKEIGLYDYRNRTYSSELGRFIQTDPIGFKAGDVNIYRYVGNNSIKRKDPYGLQSSLNTAAGAEALIYATEAGASGSGISASTTVNTAASAGILDRAYEWIKDLFSERPGSSLPGKSNPNDTKVEDRGDGKGTIRDYDDKGDAQTDYDFGHDHPDSETGEKPGDPHAHDWKNGKRGPARPLGPCE